MKSTVCSICCAFVLLGSTICARAQEEKRFASHIVKVEIPNDHRSLNRYGFVVGTGKRGKIATYFVLLEPSRKYFKEELNVLMELNGKPAAYTAYLIAPDYKPRIQGMEMRVYKINHQVSGLSNFVNMPSGGGKLYPVLETRYSTPNQINSFFKIDGKFELDRLELEKKDSLLYSVVEEGRDIAHGGLPVCDGSGKLTGIVAQNMEPKSRNVTIVPLTDIREILEHIAPSEYVCEYFNLLANNSSETQCDFDIRKAKESRAAEEERKQRIAAMSREQRRQVRRDFDYPFALSLNGSGAIGSVSLKNGSGSSSVAGFGYTYGVNLHLFPDKGEIRFSLKPRFSLMNFQLPDNYTNSENNKLSIKSLTLRQQELPVIMEFATRQSGSNNFIGIGYGLGRVSSLDYKFQIGSDNIRTERISASSTYNHRVIGEYGTEWDRFRVVGLISYQFTTSFNPHYSIILDQKPVYPFNDLGNGNLTFGLEFAVRLWGHWQNGVKY